MGIVRQKMAGRFGWQEMRAGSRWSDRSEPLRTPTYRSDRGMAGGNADESTQSNSTSASKVKEEGSEIVAGPSYAIDSIIVQQPESRRAC
jgi:hypothetical protein